jgi:Flp pilus assembly pilin Flp
LSIHDEPSQLTTGEDKMKKPSSRYVKCERRGQSLVEYALVLALVSVVCTAVLSNTGNQVTVLFNTVATAVNSADGASTPPAETPSTRE